MAFEFDPNKAKQSLANFMNGKAKTEPSVPPKETSGDEGTSSTGTSPSAETRPWEESRGDPGSTSFGTGETRPFNPSSSTSDSYDLGRSSSETLPVPSPAGQRGSTEDGGGSTDPEPHWREEYPPEWPAPRIAPRSRGIKGYVYDCQDLREEEVPRWLPRWMNSLFLGVPFAPARRGTRFVLKPDQYSDEGAQQVVLYGNITGGWVSNGSFVEVVGRRRGGGSLQASSIDLLNTDPPTHLVIEGQIPALVVWLITLLTLSAAGFLGYFLFNIGSALLFFIQYNLETLIFYLILIVAGIIWLRRTFGRRRR